LENVVDRKWLGCDSNPRLITAGQEIDRDVKNKTPKVSTPNATRNKVHGVTKWTSRDGRWSSQRPLAEDNIYFRGQLILCLEAVLRLVHAAIGGNIPLVKGLPHLGGTPISACGKKLQVTPDQEWTSEVAALRLHVARFASPPGTQFWSDVTF